MHYVISSDLQTRKKAKNALTGDPAELVLQTFLTPSPVCNQAPREGLVQHRETQVLSVAV